ncbi:hypothetical protein D3C87_1950710 [compost metagenome]
MLLLFDEPVAGTDGCLQVFTVTGNFVGYSKGIHCFGSPGVQYLIVIAFKGAKTRVLLILHLMLQQYICQFHQCFGIFLFKVDILGPAV